MFYVSVSSVLYSDPEEELLHVDFQSNQLNFIHKEHFKQITVQIKLID